MVLPIHHVRDFLTPLCDAEVIQIASKLFLYYCPRDREEAIRVIVYSFNDVKTFLRTGQINKNFVLEYLNRKGIPVSGREGRGELEIKVAVLWENDTMELCNCVERRNYCRFQRINRNVNHNSCNTIEICLEVIGLAVMGYLIIKLLKSFFTWMILSNLDLIA